MNMNELKMYKYVTKRKFKDTTDVCKYTPIDKLG
jgi:hypothetical protein